MTDRFLELCARECAAHVQRMFDAAPRIFGTGMAEIPIVGGPYLLGMPVPPELYRRVCMAMAAREQFRHDVPGWPTLPLHEKDIESLKYDDSPRLNLLGHYAYSLSPGWDYEEHPRFSAFASGLMAYEHTPDEIRNDRSLLEEFPARELEGLCGGALYWRSPAMIKSDQKRQAACDAFMARERRDAPPSG
jgi:hypothetical protein